MDLYEFCEEEDHKSEYVSWRKRKREPTDICLSLVLELSDLSVELALNSEIQLKKVCDSILETSSYDLVDKFLISDESYDLVDNFLISDDENYTKNDSDKSDLDDIFGRVVNRINSEFDTASKESASFQIQLVQCNLCNLSSVSAHKFFCSDKHPCIDNFKLKCESCNKFLKTANDLQDHMMKDHHKDSIVFLNCEKPTLSSNNLCSSMCPKALCFKIASEEIENQRTKLAGMKVSQRHNFLLERLNSQKELGFGSEHTLRLGCKDYCKSAMTELLGLSKYLVRLVFSEHLAGNTRHVHGNHGNLYQTQRKDAAIAFIVHFSKCHSENLPDKSCLRLPSYLNVKTMFENYCNRTQKHNQVCEREFYLIFQKCFSQPHRLYAWLPRVVFLPSSSHPVCNECSLISDLRKQAKSEPDTIYAEGRKKNHMLYIRRKYLLYCYRRELPIRYPSDYLHLSMDDMDQKKLQSPFTRVTTKETSNMLRLSNHLTGCILTNGRFETDRMYKLYVNNDQYPQDSNKTISIIVDLLKFSQVKLTKLPRKLHFQSDNCARDLKNQYVLSFFYLLVDLDVFDEILISHMPIGHTHSDVDFMFSLVAAHLKRMEVPTFEVLKSELSKVKIDQTYSEVIEMEHTTNFSLFIGDYLLPMSGHTGFYQFKIRKENNQTRLYLKEDELDESWKFPRDVKLLKSTPEIFSLSVSPFRSESEYSEIFRSVWNKYIPTLENKYPSDVVEEIKSKWETRIDFLLNLNETDYEPFDIKDLKPQDALQPAPMLEASMKQPVQRKETAITATFYPQEISSFSVEDLEKDVSLVFYCDTKRYRPWIGLFVELLSVEGTPKVKVEWLKKEHKHFIINIHPDGSCYTSVIDLECIMFSDVLVNCSPTGKRTGPYSMQPEVKKQILEAYSDRDNNLT